MSATIGPSILVDGVRYAITYAPSRRYGRQVYSYVYVSLPGSEEDICSMGYFGPRDKEVNDTLAAMVRRVVAPKEDAA